MSWKCPASRCGRRARTAHLVPTGVAVCLIVGAGMARSAAARSTPAYFDAPFLAVDVEYRPNGIASGDFDGDEIPDLAVASVYGASILLGQGNGLFHPYTSFDVVPRSGPQGVTGVVTADFDRDGRLDVAVSMGTDNSLTLLLGNGDGTFRTGPRFRTAEYPGRAAVADLNGDGRPDLAVPCYYGYAVNLVLNTLAGELADGGRVPTPEGPYGCGTVAAGDLDADGDADLLISANGSVWKSLGDGRGNFGSLEHLDDTYATGQFAIADIDGDGVTDIAYSDRSRGVLLRRGDGHGGFAAASLLNPGGGRNRFVFTDLNGDGLLDLVTSNEAGEYSSLSVVVAIAPGTFGMSRSLQSPHGNRDLVASDLNRDGRMDVALCPYSSSSVSIYLGDGRGKLGGGQVVDAGFLPRDATLADLDRDGRPDIVAADANARRIVLLRSTGNSEFVRWATIDTPEPLARTFAFDLDGDEATDVLGITAFYYSAEPGTLYVFRSDGRGGFLQPEEYATGVGTRDVLAGDMDGDGHLDLVIVNGGSTALEGWDLGSVDIRHGGPGGILQPPVSIPGLEHPGFVTMHDLDGDQRMDLAISHASGVELILSRAGRASLQEARPQCSLAAADLDGDGIVDLACASGLSSIFTVQGPLALYHGLGDGRFAGPQPLPLVGGGPTGVVGEYEGIVMARDLDGDGDADLVTMRPMGRSLWVYWNLGTGWFAPPSAGYGPFLQASPASVGDVNDDGGPDFVLVHNGSSLDYGGTTILPPDGFLILHNQSEVWLDVSLFDLRAEWTGSAVEVSWVAVADESGEFHVLRARESPEPAVPVAILPARIGRHSYAVLDATAESGARYHYRIGFRSPDGEWIYSAPLSLVLARPEFALRVVSPGAGRPYAVVHYALPEPGPARLELFDVAGKKVRTLLDGRATSPRGSIRWDGTDARGARVSAGIYFVRLEALGQTRMRKLLWVELR